MFLVFETIIQRVFLVTHSFDEVYMSLLKFGRIFFGDFFESPVEI